MPRWICPTCHAAMTVKPALVGAEKPCAACGAVSVVESSDAVSGVKESQVLIDLVPAASPPRLPSRDIELAIPSVVITPFGSLMPVVVVLGRVIIGASAMLYTAAMIWHMLQPSPVPLTFAMLCQIHATAYGWLFSSWVIIEIAAEVYRCRLRLDAMAASSDHN